MTAVWPIALTVAFAGLALLSIRSAPSAGSGAQRISALSNDHPASVLRLLALTEATSFGLGFAFLAFGYPYVRSVFSKYMAVSVWLAITWLFMNWFPHNALHMNAGIDMWRTIVIDFTFHVTLIVAGCFMAYAFVIKLFLQSPGQQQIRPCRSCAPVSLVGEPTVEVQGER